MTLTGPSVLDVFNTLLRQLRKSVECQIVARLSIVEPSVSEHHANLDLNVTDAVAVEQQFQNAVVDAIGIILNDFCSAVLLE